MLMFCLEDWKAWAPWAPSATPLKHSEINDCLEDNREDYLKYHYVNYICTHIMELLQF